jgi:hypothetical protein
MQQDHHAELINYLDLAMIPERGKAAVVDFTAELFNALGYAHRERLAHRRMDLPFFICGEDRRPKADVCIVDRSQNNILLLVQAEKRLENGEPVNTQAQLVAKAVAAFNENNAQREVIGHPPLAEKVSHFMSLLTLFREIALS